jgi:serine protease AprX
VSFIAKIVRSIGAFIKLSPRGGSRRSLFMVATLTVVLTTLTVAGTSSPGYAASHESSAVYIVQDGTSVGSSPAAAVVNAVGGQVGRLLGPISAVSAKLTSSELADIESLPGVHVTPDVSVNVLDTPSAGTGSSATGSTPTDVFTQQTGATTVWANGDTGAGVNVAVLDTGIDALADFSGRLAGGVDLSGEGNPLADNYGHGTFVAGLIAGNGASSNGAYTGEAPGAGLVSVKVAGVTGVTDLATVIAGVDWTIEHAQSLDIRVLNMSLGFVPFESTTVNPLDQAVEQAWNSGIVVVTAAGNAGPFNGTILSPGDDPLVITAGALADGAQLNVVNDTMTPFSSVGPTFPDGWFKPDLVTSGRSVVSLRAPGSTIDLANPTAEIGQYNFVGSGTSFSSAITAGAAALVLSAHPTYTPDQVKAALLSTTNAGPTGNPFVDGHGALNVAAAVAESGANLSQGFGDVSLSAQGHMKIQPGETVEAGYAFSLPGPNLSTMESLLAANVMIPASCSWGGPTVGWIVINLAPGPYVVPATSNRWLPGGVSNGPSSYQGSTVAPDLCNGSTIYTTGGDFSAEVNSPDTTDQVSVEFHYQNLTEANRSSYNSNTLVGWSNSQTVSPISSIAAGATVSLLSSWTLSSWNSTNWSGFTPPPSTGTSTGPQGSAWNGSAWNGSAWNGSAWNGSAWNGSAWNGSAWNGSAWNGSAWNGSAWNGSAWNGSAWNGSAWNGSAWNGSAWNGSSWN